jgi:LysM repeat protein
MGSTPVAVHAATGRWTPYTIKAGDTLWDIARRTHTTTGALVAHNHLAHGGSVLALGQRIEVPAGASSATPTPPHTTKPTKPAASTPTPGRTYVVRAGDTLGAIAVRFGVSVAAIARANGIANPHLIRVAQRLVIPGAGPTPAIPAPAKPVPNTFLGRTYPAEVAQSAAANREALSRVVVPDRAQTKALIIKIAQANGVDPKLALAIGWQESGWDQRQVSPANAIGVMQVIPSSGQWASEMVGRKLNLMKAEDNITAGVAIIRSLLRSADSLPNAIAGYYQGLASVRAHGMYADTKQYVTNVLSLRARM